MCEAIVTEYGKKLIKRFVDDEASGRLVELTNTYTGEKWKASTLHHGSGPEKASAQKLQRDGFAKMHWPRYGGRYFWLTDAGRELAEKCL